jgi:predicted ester cyclase
MSPRRRAAEDVVRRYLDAVLDGGDPRALEDVVSDEGLRSRVAVFRAAFPDLSITTDLLVVDGDLVAVHLIGRATHQGTFQGIPPTGRSWTAACTAIYRVEEGRINDFWINWDLLAILEQIGGVTRVANASA